MSDPSNPFKSLADSLLSDAKPTEASEAAPQASGDQDLGELLDAFFTAEMVRERVEHLKAIGSGHGPEAHEFLFAVAEEDADAVIRLAAYIQLHILGTLDATEALREILRDEREHPTVYPTGLMLIDELPAATFKDLLKTLTIDVPDEPFGQCALIQLVRREAPDVLDTLLSACIDKLPDGLQGIDDDVWNESILSLSLMPDQTVTTRQRVKVYIDGLAKTDPRHQDFVSEFPESY